MRYLIGFLQTLCITLHFVCLSVLRRFTYDRTNIAQRESSQRLGERVSDITFWRSELMQELDRMLGETNRLNDSRRLLEHALKDTENPLHVTKECLYFRENRQGKEATTRSFEEHTAPECFTSSYSPSDL